MNVKLESVDPLERAVIEEAEVVTGDDLLDRKVVMEEVTPADPLVKVVSEQLVNFLTVFFLSCLRLASLLYISYYIFYGYIPNWTIFIKRRLSLSQRRTARPFYLIPFFYAMCKHHNKD